MAHTLLERETGRSPFQCSCGKSFSTVDGFTMHLPMPAGERAEDPLHPRHYKIPGTDLDTFVITDAMSFNLGNAVKYLMRAGKKSSEPLLRDLGKAKVYLDREIERLTEEARHAGE